MLFLEVCGRLDLDGPIGLPVPDHEPQAAIAEVDHGLGSRGAHAVHGGAESQRDHVHPRYLAAGGGEHKAEGAEPLLTVVGVGESLELRLEVKGPLRGIGRDGHGLGGAHEEADQEAEVRRGVGVLLEAEDGGRRRFRRPRAPDLEFLFAEDRVVELDMRVSHELHAVSPSGEK